MTITICEDTPQDAACLHEALLQYGQAKGLPLQINVYPDGESLLQAELEEPAVFLLDAILPGLDGIEVARALRSRGRRDPILYLTTSRDYAVEAFSVEAMNYLLKPVTVETLFPALDAVLLRLPPVQEPLFSIETNTGPIHVPTRSIVFVEQKRHFLHFHLDNGAVILSKCLRISFETALAKLLRQQDFLRPHQSYLVHASHVAKLTQYEFRMDDGSMIPISRLRWTEIRTQYMDFLSQQGRWRD